MKSKITFFNLLISIAFAVSLFAEIEHSRPFLFDTKNIYTHPIHSQSTLAQDYFDQGMIFFYGFNYDEAVRSFEEAIKQDPNCAICYWGKALALRGNTRSLNDPHFSLAIESAQKAEKLISNATPQEQAYIRALANNYGSNKTSLRDLDEAFMSEMKKVSKQYPEDLDAAILYAKMKMDLTSDDEWESVKKILLEVLVQEPNHPGANHYYIHIIESSSHPEDGLAIAERLEHLVPFAGHLVHMPAHIYFKIGRYHDASVVNARAIKADEDLFAKGGIKVNYFSSYYLHNYQFLIASLVMEGKNNEALEISQKIADILAKDKPQLSLYMENALSAQRVLILQRFDAWDQILKEPKPGSPFGDGFWHFSRFLAYLNKNDLDKAKKEVAVIQEEQVEEEASLNILLQVMFLNAQAAIEEKEGNQTKMLEDYQKAIKLEDQLPVFDPPLWFMSSREALGFALLRAGKPQEAKKMFQEDLKRHPEKPWSLDGLKQASLKKDGEK